MTPKPWHFVAAISALLAVWLIPGAEHLLLGWLYFPLRVLPRMTADPPAVLVGFAAFAAFATGLHWLLQRINLSTQTQNAGHSWQWRTTLAISTLLVLLFVAGTAMVGATHQVIWLLTGRPRPAERIFGLRDTMVQEAQNKAVSNNVKMLALGAQNFHDVNGALPPGGVMNEKGELLHGWAILILPYIDYHAQHLDYSRPWDLPPNDKYYKCNLPRFVNPVVGGPYFDQRGFGLAHLAGNGQVMPLRNVNDAELEKHSRDSLPLHLLQRSNQTLKLSSLPDGASNTILIGTVSQRFKPWGHPANLRDPAAGIDKSPDGFGGPPSWDGAIFAYCDGQCVWK